MCLRVWDDFSILIRTYHGKSHYPCMMASRFTGIHQMIWICDQKGPRNCVFRPNFCPNDHNIKTKCFFTVSGCTKRQSLRKHPHKKLGSEVCYFVIIDRLLIPFCPLEVLKMINELIFWLMKDDDVQIENLWIWHLYLLEPSLLTNDGD